MSQNIVKNRGLQLFSLLIVLCSLLIVSCDLFNPADPDLLGKLHEELAWANAKRLTVAVTFPPEWGGSNPQQGVISPGVRDVRKWTEGQSPKMYEFNVEFSPLPAFGFERWLAFPTSVYAGLDKSKSADEIVIEAAEHLLNDNGVVITEIISSTGAIIATVLISTDVPVTLCLGVITVPD